MTAPVAFTAAERAAKRQELRQRMLARAECELSRLSRSITCYYGPHEPCVGHLRINGGSCLCECHDLAEEGTPDV